LIGHHQIGALFHELERRDLLDNTLVIITADHGEAFGEHGHYAHGDNLCLTLLRVPLLIAFSGRAPSGERIASPVSMRDLYNFLTNPLEKFTCLTNSFPRL
jgi:arylsulfatase A-like enzyme